MLEFLCGEPRAGLSPASGLWGRPGGQTQAAGVSCRGRGGGASQAPGPARVGTLLGDFCPSLPASNWIVTIHGLPLPPHSPQAPWA